MKDKAQIQSHNFYMAVYHYICMEYKKKYANIFADSSMSSDIYNLCNKYYWGGNSIQFTAGQIIDLLKSKYS